MIPIATTTISVLRAPADDPEVGEDYLDPYDPHPEREVVVSGVRARIGRGGGGMRENVAGGTQSVIGLMVWCDPFDEGLVATDQLLDEQTGDVYELDGPALHQRGFGLDHFEAAIKQVVGVA